MSPQTAIMNSLATDRAQRSGDALVASDVKGLITECFEKVAALMKDAADAKRGQDILNLLEDAESEARSWQVENE